MKACIYKISSSKTTDFYIGSTIQELRNRFKTHKSDAKLGKDKKLYDCMREHGIENFNIELVEEFNIDTQYGFYQFKIKSMDDLQNNKEIITNL